MKIIKLEIRNYRTIESLDLSFPSFYTAISGQNDSGKTNVINALRAMMKENYPYISYYDEGISMKDDFPKWKSDEKDKHITLSITIDVNNKYDTGLFNFINTYLALDEKSDSIELKLESKYIGESGEQEVKVYIKDQIMEDLKAQEILKKLQSSRTFLFHNSASPDAHYSYRYSRGLIKDLSEENLKQLNRLIDNANKGLQKVAKIQQKEITELLGRLENQYQVGLSIPLFDLSTMPVNVSLGDSKIEVNLDEWGSGTQNRTIILLTLLRAKQMSFSSPSASKITPILVIEEPESFLHHSGQAEFGRVIQDLAEEFKVQVIVTTHSPYMLSIDRPESNVLLNRKIIRKKIRETELVNTAGENWMEPFGISLGINNELFSPWRDVLFNHSENVLLVEGEKDKEYFELLKGEEHLKNKLCFKGDVFSYNGKDNLKNTVLIKFIKNKYKKIFITYDLDVEEEIEKLLIALGMKKSEDYCPIGLNDIGKKNIEGLVPDSIHTKVYSENPSLVQQAMNGNPSEKKSAKNNLKSKILDEFKKVAKPNSEDFKNFYDITKIINKVFTH